MKLSAWALAAAAASVVAVPSSALCASECGEERLAALVGEVKSADYRGDRAALARLETLLAALDAGTLGEYREYWRGFARWRRGLNGFNETPVPADLADDFERAIGHFRAALALRPGWIEPRIGLVGCGTSLMYLAGKDEAKSKALRAEYVPMFHAVEKESAENPRALWLVGGAQYGAPPPYGGNSAKAMATLGRGLSVAWSESAARPPAQPWEPTWGGPENLMSLAYISSHVPAPNRGQALAYARGALTAVPEWHYLRDVLLPQIEKLPEASR